jgi:hypothetical protein
MRRMVRGLGRLGWLVLFRVPVFVFRVHVALLRVLWALARFGWPPVRLAWVALVAAAALLWGIGWAAFPVPGRY